MAVGGYCGSGALSVGGQPGDEGQVVARMER